MTSRTERLAKAFKTTNPPLNYMNNPLSKPVLLVATQLMLGKTIEQLVGVLLLTIFKFRLRNFFIHEQMVKELIESTNRTNKNLGLSTEQISYSKELYSELIAYLESLPAFQCVDVKSWSFVITDSDLNAELTMREFDLNDLSFKGKFLN